MHRNNIIHRDLKPENIFKHNEKYKIGDFGFCKIFQSLNDLTRTPLGTLVSMAPEVIDSAPYGIKVNIKLLRLIYGHWEQYIIKCFSEIPHILVFLTQECVKL
jgi:serine/threonine protein kinase